MNYFRRTVSYAVHLVSTIEVTDRNKESIERKLPAIKHYSDIMASRGIEGNVIWETRHSLLMDSVWNQRNCREDAT